MFDFESCGHSLGWTFQETDRWSMIKWLLDFKLFKSGHRRKICPLILHQEDDLQFTTLFDYSYTISSNNSSHTYRQTVYFRYSKELALPHFLMVPEKWYHRLGTYFGMQDIDFVQYPEFSGSYLLQGGDEDYIRHHFDHPKLMKFFDKQGFYSMEGMNYLLILYVHNVVLPQTQMLQLAQIGNTIHNYLAGKTPDIELPEFNVDLPHE
jgi:hypothetical protein